MATDKPQPDLGGRVHNEYEKGLRFSAYTTNLHSTSPSPRCSDDHNMRFAAKVMISLGSKIIGYPSATHVYAQLGFRGARLAAETSPSQPAGVYCDRE